MLLATKSEVIEQEVNALEKQLSQKLVDAIIKDFEDEFDESLGDYTVKIVALERALSSSITNIRSDCANQIEELKKSLDAKIQELDGAYNSEVKLLEDRLKKLHQTCQDEMTQITTASRVTADKTATQLTEHVKQMEKILDNDTAQLKVNLNSLQTQLKICIKQLEGIQVNDFFEKQVETISELQSFIEEKVQVLSVLQEKVDALPNRIEKLELFQKRIFMMAVISAVLSAGAIILQLVNLFV